MPAVVSPCIKLCVIDKAAGLCSGCGRTLNEIGSWLSYSEAQRLAIMALLPARLEAMAQTVKRDR
jgi:predicted Fe-S protein YdhL (DUF1289 family)